MLMGVSRGSLLGMSAIAAVMIVVPAQAQAQIKSFDVPAQPAASGVAALARQGDAQILISAEDARGKRVNSVRGNLSVADAIERLVAGTGLVARATGPQTWVVVRQSSASNDSLPAFGGVPQASDIVVVAQRLNSYNAGSSSGATRTDTKALDTPQSTSVITRKLIDDQQARTIADALINASGVQVNNSLSGPEYTVRGFGSTQVAIDGMGTSSFAATPIWGADSVEVLKGPEAILAGTRAQYGGSINLTLKQPQVAKIATINFGHGSYGLFEGGVDFGGAINKAETLSFRLVGQRESARRTAHGYDGGEGSYVAPSLRFAHGGTSLTIGMEYTDKFIPTAVYGVLPVGQTELDDTVPVGIFGAKDDGSDYERTRVHARLEQDLFGSDWKLRVRGEYFDQSAASRFWQFQTRPAASGRGVLAAVEVGLDTRSWTGQIDVTGTFDTGPLSHRLLVGFDHNDAKSKSSIAVKGAALFNIFTSPPLTSFGDLTPLVTIANPSAGTTETGYLIQDQIKYGDKWVASLALRRSIFDGKGGPQSARKWLPNLGLIFKPTPRSALYANMMSGYRFPSGLIRPDGSFLPGTTSRQFEVGYKQEFRDGRLSLGTSLFQIKVDNAAISIPGTVFYESGPGQRSRGVEFEMRGNLAPGLDVSATYAHLSVKTADGTPAISAPRDSGSLWLAYRFQSEALKQWSLAAGVFAHSDATTRRNDQVNGKDVFMSVPGNARVDLHLGYTGKYWSANLGVRNLFDKRLYSTSANDFQAVIDDLERTYMLTVRVNL